MTKSNKKQQWYVFIGQNASTGRPNLITDRYSFWGTVYKAESKKTAIDYADQCWDPSSTNKCVAGGKATMRQFCLGQSVRDFEFDLQNAETVYWDEEENDFNIKYY